MSRTVLDERDTVREVGIREAVDLEEQEQRRIWAKDHRAGPPMQLDDPIAPSVDSTDEEIRCRVDRLDRQRRLGRELHQRESFGLGAGKPDQIDIFGRSRRREPRRSGGASDKEPLAVEPLACEVQKCLDSKSIESQRRHDANLRPMEEAWQILRDGGLPLAHPVSGKRWSASDLADAKRAAIASEPTGRDAEALAAFVFAWHDHWPTVFAHEYRADSDAILAWSSRHAIDDGRYLKLRRIAIENLARIF